MLFSVVIPVYNKAPYIAKAIQSVLDQTFTDFELVVVDDGSKDDSVTIVTNSLEGQPHCRLIRQENWGVSMARNKGVAVSNGDYLCFLDADDWWEPTFLEELSKLIVEFPDAGIYGTNYTIVNEAKHKTRVAKIGVEEDFEKGYINYCKAYASTMYMPLWTGAVCIPRPIFEMTDGFAKGIKLGEDFLLWIHIALNHKVVFLNKPLANYNQDVDVNHRGVGRLYQPKEHMLWNLGDLDNIEQTNKDYKQLIDNLRTYELMPYLLDNRYYVAARRELDKVDWNRQPPFICRLYRNPIWFLRIRRWVLRTGSSIKRYCFAATRRFFKKNGHEDRYRR